MLIATDNHLLKNRRTKIIATLGPVSNNADTIKQLIASGTNVFRLNMSHGTHAEHENSYRLIREIAVELKKPIAILADLCGPKIRTGRFKDQQITLINHTNVILTTRNVLGDSRLIPTKYQGLCDDIKPGDHILLDDGNLELLVKTIDGTEIDCLVIHGGVLADNKGISLPGGNISLPSLTEKDHKDAKFVFNLGVDFLALSFVRCADDIKSLRALIDEAGSNAHIIAKIESAEGLKQAAAIIDAADGMMIARGDLGIDLKPEKIPVAQSQLITLARKKFKPVIVATQMLESMIHNNRPTRAEVTDISYAVTLGADAVMLSAESATGDFPVASVSMMDRILRQTEAHLWESGAYDTGLSTGDKHPLSIPESMANATNNLVRDLMAHAIIIISKGGTSAANMIAARPASPVIAISNHADIYRKMSLMWGVIPILVEGKTEQYRELASMASKELQLAKLGDIVLLVKDFDQDPSLNYPSITIVTV